MLVVPCGFYSLCVVFLAKVSDYHDSDHAVEIKIKRLDKKTYEHLHRVWLWSSVEKKAKAGIQPGSKNSAAVTVIYRLHVQSAVMEAPWIHVQISTAYVTNIVKSAL